MELIHFSKEPLTHLITEKRPQKTSYNKLGVKAKPYGLWLSDENTKYGLSWTTYWKKEKLDPKRLMYQTKFKVDMSRILHIKTKNDVIDFSDEYVNEKDDGIRWGDVAEKYAGILVSPWESTITDYDLYDFEKMRFAWYHAWDCASCCCWDASAVEKLDHDMSMDIV